MLNSELLAADYGPLKDLVAVAGAIMAAVAAIGFAWRGRARWEPSEEDVPAGAQKVGGLVAAIAIVLLWVEWNDPADAHALNALAIGLGIAAVLFLLIYSYLVGVQSYDEVKPDGSRKRIIGGFWMTSAAKQEHAAAGNISVQELLHRAGYDADRLWSRPSRQLAKTSFQIGYLGVTISGTVALAAVAIRIGLGNV